jgi:hypothetical protein
MVFGILLGAALNNIPAGVTFGLVAELLNGAIRRRRRRSAQHR